MYYKFVKYSENNFLEINSGLFRSGPKTAQLEPGGLGLTRDFANLFIFLKFLII